MGRKFKQPFDSRGGVVVISRRMLQSEPYMSLMPQAKVLMTLMQTHWRSDKYVDFSIREAAEKIPCDPKTATKAFNQLIERGFITLKEFAWFGGRTNSKARAWRLEWMPFNDRPPRGYWEKWQDKA